ncbi:hypothetical protein KP509_31G061600 [Ceratopteris richardii]|uniref:Uncharacterized protein n=1 Tax=Ceratopteris richardii TaxID=49495 RepID=A0A8T2R0D2_CERRI|nr:hypothetical protein KP509_31G061600 [Ceratopteris richardii]
MGFCCLMLRIIYVVHCCRKILKANGQWKLLNKNDTAGRVDPMVMHIVNRKEQTLGTWTLFQMHVEINLRTKDNIRAEFKKRKTCVFQFFASYLRSDSLMCISYF